MHEQYRYLFFRSDLPFEHIVIQTNHSSFHVAALRGLDAGVPNLVLIALPNTRALERVLRKLQANNVPHLAWREPDNDFGLTAIATAPLDADSPERALMKNYRLYHGPEVSTESTAASKADGACSTHAGTANAGAVV